MLKKLSDRLTEHEHEGEIVLMSLANGDLFALDGVAAQAWRLIDGGLDAAALKDALAADYALERAEISGDVDALIAQMKKAGLLAEN